LTKSNFKNQLFTVLDQSNQGDTVMRTRKKIDFNSPRLKLTLSSLFGVLFLIGCGVSNIEIPEIQVEVV
jgi:hypothetical protein